MKNPKEPNKQQASSQNKTPWIVVAAVVVVVAAVAGTAIYLDQVAPFRTTVVSVEEEGVTMRTFIKRAYLSGQEPLALLQKLADEQIIKLVAPYPPYEVRVEEDDIAAYLRDVARGESESIGDADYKEWYRQQLNESRLSDGEFKELVRVNLLMRGLSDYLAERVPTVTEQVQLSMIPIEGLATARQIRERVTDGASFEALAGEFSIDEGLKTVGGDIGWRPRGALLPHIARAAFDELAVGEVSEPLFLNDEIFALVKVNDRAAARNLEEDARRVLQERALDDWLQVERKNHKIEFHGFSGAYDSETDAWVKWQLARMKRQD